MIHEHIHARSNVYPTLAAGVTITAGAAWTLGNYAVIVPANTITQPFDIHYMNIGSASANDTYEIVLYSGADGSEVEIGRVRFTRNSTQYSPPLIPITTDIVAKNSQIKAKIASSAGSNNAVASIYYHTY